MDNSSYHGLAFLLSLGTLPIACTVEKGDSDSDGATTGGPTTDAGTTTGTTGGSDGMTTGGTTTGEPTSGSSSPTTGGETETGGAAGPCEAYVAHAMMCDPEVDPVEELMSCQDTLKQAEAVYGAMCAMLYDEYLACLSQAECNDESACDGEVMAIEGCSPELGPICMAYGAKYAECYMVPTESAGKYCQVAVNQANFSYGPQCGAAYEEYFACFSELSCAELEMGNFCQAEQMGIEMACV